jgi:hypothetical protein
VLNFDKVSKQVEDAYRGGCSDSEVARILGVTLAQFKKMYKDNSAFATMVDRGRTLQQAWWEEQGRIQLTNKNFNVSMWSFNMKNRFGWADKVENTTNTSAEPMSDVEMKEELKKLEEEYQRSLGKTEPEILVDTSKPPN